MAYTQDFKRSARRHLRAAHELHGIAASGAQPGCRAVAGYLFGLAGELAVKELMRETGLRPLPANQQRDDPFYAHFPSLKTRILDTAAGRRSEKLRQLAEDATLFQHWDTTMRYAPTSDIRDEWITKWRTSAEKLVNEMDLP